MSVLPTPRIANDAALKPLILLAEKLGTRTAMSPSVRGPRSAIAWASSAVTAMGVVCRFDARRSAVTTISCSPTGFGGRLLRGPLLRRPPVRRGCQGCRQGQSRRDCIENQEISTRTLRCCHGRSTPPQKSPPARKLPAVHKKNKHAGLFFLTEAYNGSARSRAIAGEGGPMDCGNGAAISGRHEIRGGSNGARRRAFRSSPTFPPAVMSTRLFWRSSASTCGRRAGCMSVMSMQIPQPGSFRA